ncbi:MAG TPA: hypothetical protein VJ869_02355 [Sphaerochaeta sp.]|nr:hypothetical protein [Sphaerochaeta sp.]
MAIDHLEYACPQASVISLGKRTKLLSLMIEKLLIGIMDPEKVMEESKADFLKEYNESFNKEYISFINNGCYRGCGNKYFSLIAIRVFNKSK